MSLVSLKSFDIDNIISYQNDIQIFVVRHYTISNFLSELFIKLAIKYKAKNLPWGSHANQIWTQTLEKTRNALIEDDMPEKENAWWSVIHTKFITQRYGALIN